MLAVWAWITGSKVGRWLGLVFAALLAVLVIFRRGELKGRRDVERDAIEAAEERRQDRVQIDREVRATDDPVGELRDKWSRDR